MGMYNYALDGDVPKEWADCTIVPIHKKGSVTNSNNYRSIALLATGGKIFAGILTKRLMQWLVPRLSQSHSAAISLVNQQRTLS